MLPQVPVSIETAALSLIEWLEHQQESVSQVEASAVRAQVRVHPGRNASLPWLRANCCSQKLFFRSREQTFEVAALGFAHVASGPVLTEQVQSSLVRILNPKHPEMRFYGACRFDSSQQSQRDSEWHPYNGFTFVLPAVELYRNCDGQFFLAANFYPPSGATLVRSLLHRIMATPLSLQTLDASFMLPCAQSITELTPFATWDAAMTSILGQLSSGQYDKIVLARRKRFSFPSTSAPDPVHVISALDEQNREKSTIQPHSMRARRNSFDQNTEASTNGVSYLFCLQLDHDKAFIGCTPERLFYLKDREIWTEALAGTVRRSIDGNEGEPLSELLSQKNLEEHRFVVDYIRTALSESCVHVETNGPHVRRLPWLMHLVTHIQGKTTKDTRNHEEDIDSHVTGRTHNVFQALQTMHPTPAVCGMPRERTQQELHRLEDFDRGFFAGPLGWFSCDSGEFCVAIRSALIHGSDVTAFAGSGIVQASESKSEWEETELKMSAFTDLFSLPPWRAQAAPFRTLLNNFHLSPRTSPRKYGGGFGHDGTTQDSRVINGECYGNEFSLLTTSASSSISVEGTLTQTTMTQTTANVPSRSPSASSLGSTRTVGASALPSQSGYENEYFDPSQIEKMPNINALWGSCCVEELCRNGVRTFFVAPGSRSAPLAVGVVRSRHAKLHIAHDERGAGFLAIGYARATRRAAAVITSSGTAVANLLPAVVEASMDSLPIILLTADRPPELRDVGANQAIHQPGIFGEYTKWSKDLPCPSAEIPLRNVLSDVDYAVYMSGSSPVFEPDVSVSRGPIHLNMMFREKLAPGHQPWDRLCVSNIPLRWKLSFTPLTAYWQRVHESVPICKHVSKVCSSIYTNRGSPSVFAALRTKQAGLIIVGGASGAAQTENDGLAIIEIAYLLGWPIISDVCGGLRFDSSYEVAVHYADQIYSSELARQMFRPDAVLQFGERVTSKRINRLVEYASSTCEGFVHILVSPNVKRADPVLTVTHRLISNIPSVLRQVQEMAKAEPTYSLDGDLALNGTTVQGFHGHRKESKLQALRPISKRIDLLLNQMIAADEYQQLTEPWCARILSEALPRPNALFIGNSMPIRDLDGFAGFTNEGLDIKVAGNRGASGIDGIISSGIGFGIGLNLDVTIVLGDMSMIHDMNALHLLRSEDDSLRIRVTIVVVNNGGGGIFSMLPIAKHRSVFSPVFDTPHGIRFDKACEMFGIDYVATRTPRELREAIQKAYDGHRMIEAVVTNDHASNAALHQRLGANVAQQVSTMLTDRG